MEQKKRALVTGAGKRLGRAMALCLAGRGYDVAVHYRTSAAEAEQVADEIKALGQAAVTVDADLLIEAETQALVSSAEAALGGPLTVLVNNASIFEYDNIDTATRESWDRHMESNLRAPFVLTQKFAAALPKPPLGNDGEARPTGLVINMLDQRVRKLTPEYVSYTLAKMGLWALTKTTAQALGPNIRVNAIGPGPTLRGENEPIERFEKQRAATILEHGSDPEDIVSALIYFLDAPAVTGQLLCVDGGQHLAWQSPDILGPT